MPFPDKVAEALFLPTNALIRSVEVRRGGFFQSASQVIGGMENVFPYPGVDTGEQEVSMGVVTQCDDQIRLRVKRKVLGNSELFLHSCNL